MKTPPIVKKNLAAQKAVDQTETVEQEQTELSEVKKPKNDGVRKAKKLLKQAKKLRKSKEKKEEKRFTATRRKRRARILFVFSAIGGMALFVVLGLFTPIMSLKNIELYGLEIISEDEVQESLKTLHGKPLALIKETEVSRLLKEYKQIEQYSLQLIPPDTMSIVILERTPVVAVKDGDKVNLLDAAGITVLSVPEKEKPISVPFLVDKSAKVGSPEFHSSVKVIRGMTPQLIEKVASVTAKDGDKVTVHLNDGTSVFWGEASENALKAKVLETTLEATAKNKIKEINISAPLSPVFK